MFNMSRVSVYSVVGSKLYTSLFWGLLKTLFLKKL